MRASSIGVLAMQTIEIVTGGAGVSHRHSRLAARPGLASARSIAAAESSAQQEYRALSQ